ncbi:hypothetical protein [uncultured Tateyamaria sp.]|uniref:hypothetical protein n=1 Tax=uncultured Tateyamaria sp. TaxID=455651 RepID=UPI0026035F02|nr:hypothetical protein [uncultured Tateyamaria sp.]
MTPDMYLVLGIVIAGFSIPSILSAVSDGRAPRASAITILIAGGLILLAIQTQPGGYTLQEIPDVFVRVIAPFVS